MDLAFRNHLAITPADVDLPQSVDAVFAAGAGTVIITDIDGTVVTWTLPAGGTAYIRTKRVAAASTATGLVGLIY